MQRLNNILKEYTPEQQEIVQRAGKVALDALSGLSRDDGHSFFSHPVLVAKIVAEEIGLGWECVAAVFLHEAYRGKELDATFASFPKEVQDIATNLNHISAIQMNTTRLDAATYKNMIASYSSDPRVIVLKIADRLEIMRRIGTFSKAKAESKILETYMLYIPIAHQLGLYNIKSELEDIYFKHTHPMDYRMISNHLKATERMREEILKEFIEPLKEDILKAGISYHMKMRTKSPLSIFRKMEKQKVGLDGVFDIFAIRFIIDLPEGTSHDDELKACWDVFSLVTNVYTQDTKRLRDWLSKPKPNGYESLHITVCNADNYPIEVQIRTSRMDQIAESGLASHWSYKGIQAENTLSMWLSSVRGQLESKEGLSDVEDIGEADVSKKMIFVYTPSGELRHLSIGATVLDFAFDIHTNIGCKCTGGKINGKVASIKDELHTGDTVEILTSKTQKPRENWLTFVVSSKARTKIRQVLSKEEFDKANLGRETLDRRLKNWKLTFNAEQESEYSKLRGYKTLNAFYAAIGEGVIDVAEIKEWLTKPVETAPDGAAAAASEDAGKWNVSQTSRKSKDDILVLSAKQVKGLDYKMSKCCNPVYGDEVFGFVSRLDGIKIHRMTCPNAARLIEQYPYRIQKVVWSETPSGDSFQTTLRIIADLDPGVVGSIMDVINSFKATLRQFNVSENRGVYDITATISVVSAVELDKVISVIRKQRHIQRITRR